MGSFTLINKLIIVYEMTKVFSLINHFIIIYCNYDQSKTNVRVAEKTGDAGNTLTLLGFDVKVII